MDFHGDAAVPFGPHPAGTAIQFCGMAGTIAEADTLDPTVEGDVSADYFHLDILEFISLAVFQNIYRIFLLESEAMGKCHIH